ncbi:MAG: hypothetical protein HY741_03295 [Chloroflexi bacterium]|nr:hypothetical protein [Chloroflexota bacterium]
MTDEQLAQFLVAAKRATYAAQGDSASVTPLLPSSRQLEFRLGNVLYRDIYFGFAFFVGQETVHVDDAPVWAMGYAGGIVDANADEGAVYKFLQFALRQVDAASPYRGPGLIRGEGFQYTSQTTGTLDNFWGIERISQARAVVYELRYHGGKLR